MKILITGGAGFIGSNLALAIQKEFKDYEVTVLDDFSVGVESNLEGFKGEIIKGKIENEKLVKDLKRRNFDLIFHNAAITDTTLNNQAKIMSVNFDGFKNILSIVEDSENAKLIYASSAAVYGKGKIPMKESQKLMPLNAYAVSKAKADGLAMRYAKKTNKLIIGLRYFNVYGPREKHKKKSASMILQIAEQIENGKVRLFKYGEQARDFIYIDDVIKANFLAMELKKSCILNIGTGEKTTFNRVAEIIGKTLKKKYKIDYFDNPYKFYQDFTQADTSLAEKILGFKAEYSIEEGISEYLCNLGLAKE